LATELQRSKLRKDFHLLAGETARRTGIGRPKGPAYSRFFAPFRPDCRGISTVGDVKEGPREQNDAF
jgi:hypothetical protein